MRIITEICIVVIIYSYWSITHDLSFQSSILPSIHLHVLTSYLSVKKKCEEKCKILVRACSKFLEAELGK